MSGTGLLLGVAYGYAERVNLLRQLSQRELPKTGDAVRSIHEYATDITAARNETQYLKWTQRSEKATGFAKAFYASLARTFGKSGTERFQAAGKGFRGALIGAAAYETLGTIGSIIAGDYKGGMIQAASGVGALLALGSKKGGVGLAAAILAVPFVLRTGEDPEKLRRIYSGEEKVAVKSGGAWEMGRCIRNHCEIPLYDGSIKKAEEVKIGDILVGRKGVPVKVKAIYIRKVNDYGNHTSNYSRKCKW
jgi:hypothetical protein